MNINGTSLALVPVRHPSLLEPLPPAYSNMTVRRAFIVWMYCGQANKFKDVCNFYHYLEKMEETLPLEQKIASRNHELNMFISPPPTSPFLRTYFPKLYCKTAAEPLSVKKYETIKDDKNLFKVDAANPLPQKGATTAEILETSKFIRKYCQTQMIPLKKFLEEYKNYADKCQLSDTVHNVASYIKRKMIQAELELMESMPKTFSFLDETDDFIEVDDSLEEQVVEAEVVEPEAVKPEEVRPVETNNLKLLLGLNKSESNVPTRSAVVERRYSSCTEFFKSFSSHPQNAKATSTSALAPKIEDFVKMFDKNWKSKSKSEESLPQSKTSGEDMNLSSPDCFDFRSGSELMTREI